MFSEIANRVSIITIIINIALFIIKLTAGIFGHSAAMISDAIHSASDVLSTIIVMIGIKLSSKEADNEHPYGHERFECIAEIVLSMILGITGLSIGLAAIQVIVNGELMRLWFQLRKL